MLRGKYLPQCNCAFHASKRRVMGVRPLVTRVTKMVAAGYSDLAQSAADSVPVPVAPPTLGGSALAYIGNTPLIRLERIAEGLPGIEILAKAEWFNPGGSVKDRAAWNIVQEAMQSGGAPGGGATSRSDHGQNRACFSIS